MRAVVNMTTVAGFAAATLALSVVLLGPVADDAGAAKSCATVKGGGATYQVRVTGGNPSCGTARSVIRYVITHGPATQGSPGRAPRGWSCAYTYGRDDSGRTQRAGPTCNRGRDRVEGVARGLTPTQYASVRSCSAISVGSLTARDVRRSSRLSCGLARKLIGSTYGLGPLRRVKTESERDEDGDPIGRPTIWFNGGWRCTTGAGGMACWNARRENVNEIDIDTDQDMALTASI